MKFYGHQKSIREKEIKKATSLEIERPACQVNTSESELLRTSISGDYEEK
jgi:hypothetical protein